MKSNNNQLNLNDDRLKEYQRQQERLKAMAANADKVSFIFEVTFQMNEIATINNTFLPFTDQTRVRGYDDRKFIKTIV